MKTQLLMIICLVLFPLAGWTQQQISRVATGNCQQSHTNNQPAPSAYQVNQPSQGQYSSPSQQHNVSSTNVYAPQSQQHSAGSTNVYAPQSSGTYHPSRGKSHYPAVQVKNVAVSQKPPTPALFQTLKDSTQHQGILINAGSNPKKISTDPLGTKQIDSTFNIGCQTKPVIYYRLNSRECHFHTLGLYGVQIGYYKDYNKAREALKKYKSQFKTAGVICEDWNVSDKPYRLILGRCNHQKTAIRLLIKVRHLFPFSFVVKYA